MVFETQVHILELCVSCPTVSTFAVFRDFVEKKWPHPDKGRSEFLNLLRSGYQVTVTACIHCSFEDDPGTWV